MERPQRHSHTIESLLLVLTGLLYQGRCDDYEGHHLAKACLTASETYSTTVTMAASRDFISNFETQALSKTQLEWRPHSLHLLPWTDIRQAIPVWPALRYDSHLRTYHLESAQERPRAPLRVLQRNLQRSFQGTLPRSIAKTVTCTHIL